MHSGDSYASLLHFHEDLARVQSPRQLRAVLRKAALSLTGHSIEDCEDAARARARVFTKSDELHARIEHDLTLQPPLSDGVVETLERLRLAAKAFAHEVIDGTPSSREQSLALTSIETALSQAIAGVVRNQS